MKIGVLVSVGVHPASGRPRAALGDLAALRLALDAKVPVLGLHAGPCHDALLDYGAHGLRELRLADAGPACGEDAAQALAHLVQDTGVDLLLAGSMGESAHALGLLPYRVARILGWPVLADAVQLQARGRAWHAVTRLDATTRRRHADARHSVLLAWPAGAERMAYAAQQRAALVVKTADGRALPPPSRPATPCAVHAPEPTLPAPAWTVPRPEDPALARLRTLRGQGGTGPGQIVFPPTEADAVRLVLGFLQRHGFEPHHHTARDGQP